MRELNNSENNMRKKYEKINELKPVNERLYQIGVNSFELQYQIVKYVSHIDISVLFLEDDYLVEHTSYGCFLRGSIENPNNNPNT